MLGLSITKVAGVTTYDPTKAFSELMKGHFYLAKETGKVKLDEVA